MNPYEIMLVCKDNDRIVARVPAKASNAETRIQELVRQHGSITIDYEKDQDSGILAALMSPGR